MLYAQVFLRNFTFWCIILMSVAVLKISLEEQKNLRFTLLRGNLEYPFRKISVTKKGWVADVFNDWIAEEVRRVDARAASRSRPSLPRTAEDRLNAGNFCEFMLFSG